MLGGSDMFFFLQRFKCTDGHNYVFFICTISMVVHSLQVQEEKDTPMQSQNNSCHTKGNVLLMESEKMLYCCKSVKNLMESPKVNTCALSDMHQWSKEILLLRNKRINNIYLISMDQSCLSCRNYFTINKATDLTGMKSVVHMHNCHHVPLKK